MLAKLAFRNVRRSVRDYAIYFVTLVFGVAVFYAFNSVTGQSILFDLEDTATASVFEMTGQMLGMFSVVIACVLGFLVLYANGFLIRRRKQEFGTYLMLGMNPRSVSAIVLMETVAVGLVSLGVGLALGFALSQGLSFVTAGLFNIQMEQYRFVFSTNAFLLTLGCFVLIFAVTGLFNTLSIRRYKLIDLLSARSKNARFRVRNPWISLVGFLAAVAVIAWSYVTLVDNGLMQFDEGFWRATALMVAGTFLFFWSLAGFALAAIERTRGIYFKGLAMFTTRQIASKVNTAFVSLSVVCIMLFFSLTVFSTGMGLARAFSGNVEEGTLYDATLTANVYLNAGGIHDEEALASMSEEDREYQRVADEKAAAIERLRAQGKTVCMVGDGINDTPALAVADCAVAMGGGSDIAIESAGILLPSGNLEKLPELFDISRATIRTIRQNLTWALFYNLVSIPVAALGVLHPSICATAMSASSIGVLMHSLRLKDSDKKERRFPWKKKS